MLETKRIEKTVTPQKVDSILNIELIRDTEQGILNYMLLSNDNFIKIKNKLNKTDFTFMIHRIIFEYLCILEKMFLKESYCGISDISSLLKVFAKVLEEKQNIKMTSTLDILSQSPSTYIDNDLEIINVNSMEREIAVYNKRIVQNGTIETKDGKTWFNFINNRLISIGTTNISHLPTELHDNFADTLNSLSHIDFQDKENEVSMSFDENAESTDGIESFYLKKDISYLKWFDDICQWADKYHLDEKTFPRDRYKLQDLLELDISNKEINELPKEISKLTSLKILTIDNNNIKHLPEGIYQLKDLGLFSFISNDISYISEKIINFKNLLIFGACNNSISSLPKNFFKLKNLITICLHGNKLTSLPDAIGSFPMLSSLTISNNDIETLPASMINLKKLSSLDIENTKIFSIPIESLQLTRLCINDELLPFIAQNIQYLDVDTINLSSSHLKHSLKIVKDLNFKTDTENWMEEKDKKDNGCIKLSKYNEEVISE